MKKEQIKNILGLASSNAENYNNNDFYSYIQRDELTYPYYMNHTTLIRQVASVIRTGITCKKIPCYMRDSACRWLIVQNAKIFRSYVKYF